MVPKAELHVHLEGTATPDLVRRIAQRNGLEMPEGVFAAPDRFAWRDFLDFLNTYNLVCSVIRTGEDYRDITYEYLSDCADGGAIYVELTASIDHSRIAGLGDAEHWEGIAAGIDDARADHGIEARILSVAVRNYGVERAVEIAELTRRARTRTSSASRWPATRPATRPSRSSTPTGSRPGGPRLHRARRRMGRAGLGARRARATRFAYRPRGARDRGPRARRELARRGVTLEVCPTSNIVLGVFPSYEGTRSRP